MKRLMSAMGLAALLTAGLVTAPAAAGGVKKIEEAKPKPRKVSYRDLDLTTEAGERKLRKRLSSAAYGVCTTDQYGRFIRPSAANRSACHKEVMAGLEPKVVALVQNVRLAAKSGGDAKAAVAAAGLVVAR
ncbi:UrcA family protein [Sphingomonas gilva]|uniref:UrcA family protein n=1 Tax=Sphingomonas gilva TaxID=2305907 RepID=A0A396RPN6_9SPHN|nr:UrcA family protein [Sphingomonas gilva]RHW18490.1 UrcA family protein [Sphingomonas gilva]